MQEVIDYINQSVVRRIHLMVFTEDNTRPLYRIRYTDAPERFKPSVVVERAVAHFRHQDFGQYDVITNNCEHFATDCTFGKKFSFQVAQKTRSVNSACVCM